MTTPRSKPIRVLCLPGFGQQGVDMLGKMYKLRKVFGDDVECVAMDPPMVLGHPTVHYGAAKQALTYEEEYCGWWPRNYTHSFMGDYEAFDHALRATRDFVERNGPFDAVMGFSQGGNALAHMLPLFEKPWLHPAFAAPPASSTFYSPRSSISASSDGDASTSLSSLPSVPTTPLSTSPPLSAAGSDYFPESRRSSFGEADASPIKPFKCAIMVGAYGPADSIAEHWFDSPIKCPTLHLIGKNDAWIPPNYQVDTAAKFNSKTLWHIGGHFIPQTHEHHVAMRDFLLEHCK
ncbi:hypothetical protein JCM10450v2_006656 [Rhodotorula kratochvilovae]